MKYERTIIDMPIFMRNFVVSVSVFSIIWVIPNTIGIMATLSMPCKLNTKNHSLPRRRLGWRACLLCKFTLSDGCTNIVNKEY